ncbi:MAG: hypothetical protein M1831_001677 [Alyxoria varia]|nr:MAG: hypothetical protein M1831_001677 [Alyxoria varia]
MPFNLFIFVILASFLVFLSPAASKKSKGTVSIPRLPRSGHVRNGFQAKKRVFQKMGWQMPEPHTDGEKDFAVKHGQIRASTASTPARPEPYYAEYLSPFTIGGQLLQLDIDTGSADTWCFSTLQPIRQQTGHGVFDPAKSPSYRRMDGFTFSIRYGDGTGAEGVVGEDILSVGEYEQLSTEFPISLATNVTDEFVDDTKNDGLVGLGFSNINSVRPRRQRTLHDYLRRLLDLPLFTVNLLPDGSGTYDFGFLNEKTHIPSTLVKLPINPAYGFWQLASKTVLIDRDLSYNPEASPAIADTGTSLLITDPHVAEAYWGKIPDAGYSFYYGGYVFPCSAQLPSLAIVLGQVRQNGRPVQGNATTVRIGEGFLNYARVTEKFCYGGLQSNEGYGLQVYGDVLFRSGFFGFWNEPGNQSLWVALKA